jgi:hypothetical protein
VKRLAWLVVLAVFACGSLTGCRTDAAKAQVFITRDGKVVIESAPDKKGETIIRVENNNPAKKRVVLLQLDEGQDPAALPVDDDGVVPVGKASDLEHEGEGYTVVEKVDTMRPYFGGDQRPVVVLHTYLREGSYVLLSNLPGDYAKGFWTKFDVGGDA